MAQSKLEGTQLLALGRGGLYSPLHGQVFAEELPRLFGPGGKYPEVDAVVFCIRLWGGMSIAEGVRDYPVSMPDVRWTYPIKAPVVTRLQRLLVRPVAAPLHSASLVSSKLIDWLRADLRNQQNAVDLEAVEAVAPVLRDEVFIPIRAHAARIDIPIAFLYLPSIAEYERNQGPVQARMRELTLAALEEAGVLWMDASDWVVGEPEASDEFFFPVDHHPNAGGHARMGEALAAIVRALELQD